MEIWQFCKETYVRISLLIAILMLTATDLHAATYNMPAATGNPATDSAAVDAAISACSTSTPCEIYFQNGTYVVDKSFTLNYPVLIRGESSIATVIYATGLTSGAIFNFTCTSAKRCENVQIRNVQFNSNNALVDGISLTWVFDSIFANVYFYHLNNGLVCAADAFSNVYADNWSFSLGGAAYRLTDECSNSRIVGGRIGSSSYGIDVQGNVRGLIIDGPDCEGISTNGACIYLRPGAGKAVSAIRISNMHTECLQGPAIFINGVDANSVQALTIQDNFLDGGSVTCSTPTGANASYAIILQNVTSFRIANNYFYDWHTAAAFRNATESYGSITENSLNGLSLPSLSATVNLRNNH
jgi:hypothetical protein